MHGLGRLTCALSVAADLFATRWERLHWLTSVVYQLTVHVEVTVQSRHGILFQLDLIGRWRHWCCLWHEIIDQRLLFRVLWWHHGVLIWIGSDHFSQISLSWELRHLPSFDKSFRYQFADVSSSFLDDLIQSLIELLISSTLGGRHTCDQTWLLD